VRLKRSSGSVLSSHRISYRRISGAKSESVSAWASLAPMQFLGPPENGWNAYCSGIALSNLAGSNISGSFQYFSLRCKVQGGIRTQEWAGSSMVPPTTMGCFPTLREVPMAAAGCFLFVSKKVLHRSGSCFERLSGLPSADFSSRAFPASAARLLCKLAFLAI
jgi:hypothetical protein